jgi:hypothetical protein
MKTSETLRQHAANCEQLEEAAPTEAARKRFQRMRHAWLSLAASQDWLDGLVSPHLEGADVTARFSRRGTIEYRRLTADHAGSMIDLATRRLSNN